MTIEEGNFTSQFERECAFIVGCLTVDTPSNSWCIKIVEEVPGIESVLSHGMQNPLSSTPYSGVTCPPKTTSFSDLLSRQIVCAGALENHILISERRAP
jgi:hypothetical protein